MGLSCDFMVLNSFVTSLNLMVLALLLLPERYFLSLYIWCTELFSLYYFLVLYTLPKSAQGHIAGMSFLYRSAHHSDVLHYLSYSCQHSPSRGWTTRRVLLSFSYYFNWHSNLLLVDFIGMWSSLVDRLCDFRVIKNIACLLVRPSFKIPSLYIGLFCLLVGDSVKDNLLQLFRVHFWGSAWYREKRKVVIQFR